MKICLVHHEYPEETSMGGIATYQRMLAQTLKQMGHYVTVISASLDDDKEEDDNGVHVIRFSKCIQYDTIEYMRKYREKVADKLHELYLNNKLDIVESPEMGAECLRYIEKYHDVPVVCKLHTSFEIWAEFNETTLPEDVHKQLVNWERKYIHEADAVTSCTSLLYEMMKSRNQIQRNDVVVLGNPANITNFQRINCEKDNSILYLGGLEQRKGVLVLAKAIPIVLKAIPNLKFRFIGSDTTSNDKKISTISYIKDIVPSNFHKNLEFIGHIDNSDVIPYCSKSIIGVLPSTFDNLPYVAMEELLCELPLIASDNTGVIEMITDTESGVLFKNGNFNDLAQKIINLYHNRKVRDKMGNLGRNEIIKKFSPNKIVLKNVDIYQDTINRFLIKRIFKGKIKEISLVPYGIANFVYKITTNDGIFIAKCYRSGMKVYDFQPIIYRKNEKNFMTLSNVYDDENIIIMKYINGEHKEILTMEDINIVIDFMEYYHKNSKKYNVISLQEKIKKCSLITYKYRNEIQEELNSFWIKNKKKITRLLEKDLVFSHGDLSLTNILVGNEKIGFIDFDETCMAPKYYDLVVFVTKNSFINGIWKKEQASKIIKAYRGLCPQPNQLKIPRKILRFLIQNTLISTG